MLCRECQLLCNNPEVESKARIFAAKEAEVPDNEIDAYMVNYPHKPNFVALKDSARHGCPMCLFLQKTLETDSKFVTDAPESVDDARLEIGIVKTVDGWGWSRLSLSAMRYDGEQLRPTDILEAEIKICEKFSNCSMSAPIGCL